ncbi:MAG TPA: hypothetical protein VKZ73_04615 [Microbacterium sp.]|nr:hypothetical protein [Microbacterium sp.]
MAQRALTRPRLHTLITLPAWARVLVVYLSARIVTTLLIALSSALAPADGRHGPHPSILDYIVAWDAAWYREIALNGYPDEIPVDGHGQAQQNAWAFMPVYPWLARILAAAVPGAGFGSDDVWAVADAWAIAAAVISLVAGFFACWGVHALLADHIGRIRALWGVAFVAFGPLALMFQVGYAEALFLALIVWALVAIRRESWWWLYAIIPVMAFTRPGELALPLTIALYGLWRIRHRAARPIRRAEVGHILATGALGSVLGFAWPVIANTVTRNPNAYFETELSWRRGWVGEQSDFFPGDGWIQAARAWSGIWGVPHLYGYALLVLLVACAIGLFFLPSVRALGIETRLWGASYLVYAALVVFPQSSVLRLLLPLAPLAAGALATPRLLRSSRILILVALTALQFWWMHAMYGLGNTFYLIP